MIVIEKQCVSSTENTNSVILNETNVRANDF